jgi:hypothetical protein
LLVSALGEVWQKVRAFEAGAEVDQISMPISR